jgi:hypothetical protein
LRSHPRLQSCQPDGRTKGDCRSTQQIRLVDFGAVRQHRAFECEEEGRQGWEARAQAWSAGAVPVDNLQQLIQAKKFVDQIGGLEKARAAVDVLAQILG